MKRSLLHQELVYNWQAVSESGGLVLQKLLVHLYHRVELQWSVVQMQHSLVRHELAHRDRVSASARLVPQEPLIQLYRVLKSARTVLSTNIEVICITTLVSYHIISYYHIVDLKRQNRLKA